MGCVIEIAPLATQVTPAKIVDENENNVLMILRLDRGRAAQCGDRADCGTGKKVDRLPVPRISDSCQVVECHGEIFSLPK